jgi:hypothetical protein
MQEVYLPHQMNSQQESEIEKQKEAQRQMNSQAYLDQIRKVQQERNMSYNQTLQMQIQQHELQKQQDLYEKAYQQNTIKERAAVVKNFEQEQRMLKMQEQAHYR